MDAKRIEEIEGLLEKVGDDWKNQEDNPCDEYWAALCPDDDTFCIQAPTIVRELLDEVKRQKGLLDEFVYNENHGES